MAAGRRSRRRTRYFVLRTDGGHTEVARISRHGSPSFFDAASGMWVHNPLLGAEIRQSDDWEPIAEADLPAGIVGVASTTAGTRRGRAPKGRHVQAGPG
ncbi:hypothetical protein IFT73_15480 [Aeromicrobium sp. CFBP 8757]|uniref:hypothetical protein n=1 Tax=Aeromicrobium sp. CFBP 8757 TaxID=2775288 RepID=UPI00177D7D78|nr:hypothetical protein [Aeromicrobium sp. CFBP 8757]MBD8608260.1 hypothetical protein [Aeromicrobium sp. CFBP 8757]